MTRHFQCVVLALLPALPGAASAADTYAHTNGDWSSATTWTNGVPAATGLTVIGATYPATAAHSAFIFLSQNSYADTIYLGADAGTVGTLDLGGFTLSANHFYLDRGSVMRTGGGTLSLGSLNVLSFSFAPGDTVGDLFVGGNTTTVAVGNVTRSLMASSQATMTLGADLNLSSELDLQGTLNCNGHAISAANVMLGFPSGPCTLANRGPITAPELTVSSQFSPGLASFGLTAADSIGYLTLLGVNAGVLPAGLSLQQLILYSNSASSPMYSSVTTSAVGNVTSGVSVYPGSTLTLGADLAFPSNGAVDLQGTLNANGHLISANFISLGVSGGPFSLLNRGPLKVSESLTVSSQYTPGAMTFNLTTADTVYELDLYGVGTVLSPGIKLPSLYLYSNGASPPTYATAVTSTTTSLTLDAGVEPGCTLTLGANLNLGSYLSLNGTLSVNGYAISAGSVQLGLGGPFILSNRGPISTYNLSVSSQYTPGLTTFTLTPADSVSSFSLYGVSTVLGAGVGVRDLSLYSNLATPPTYATAATTAAGSVTNSIYIDPGCTLTMGADMALGSSADVRGILDAKGHALSASIIYMGYYDGPASFQNDGRVTANSWKQGSGTHARLSQLGDVLGTLLLTKNSALTVGDAAGQTTGLTIGNSTSADLSIDAGSDLTLEVNGLAGGWVFRWANPSGGDHIADLQNLINGGEITFSYLNGGTYALTTDSTYTYISVIGVPEPSTFGLVAIGLLAVRLRWVRGLHSLVARRRPRGPSV
jgi:hypothetical protein